MDQTCGHCTATGVRDLVHITLQHSCLTRCLSHSWCLTDPSISLTLLHRTISLACTKQPRDQVESEATEETIFDRKALSIENKMQQNQRSTGQPDVRLPTKVPICLHTKQLLLPFER